jgi:hypothetical protein
LLPVVASTAAPEKSKCRKDFIMVETKNKTPWATLYDFAEAHDMVIANWLFKSELLYNMESHNEFDEEEGYYKDIFQLFIVERDTIEDIEEYNIDFPYYINDDLGLYVVGITAYGMSWKMINIDAYINDNIDEDIEDEE